MLRELDEHGELYQQDVVNDIETRFGATFVYDNESGNPAIDGRVLRAFRELTGDSVVWMRSERLWRKREPGDEPGRQQAY